MPAFFPRRAAVAVAIAGLAASAGPASATGCRVDANAEVSTSVVAVHVSAWHDEGQQEPGTKGEREVTISRSPGGTTHLTTQTNNPTGPGLVEQYTGVDYREIVCGALER